MSINIGTAGWTIPRDVAGRFPTEGTSLQRYSALFPVTEINSSFHRPHRLSTWERWRDSVPPHFRFSVKLPKTVTHQAKLVGCGELLDGFFEQADMLGERLAVLLVQLPPKLAFDPKAVSAFFSDLLARTHAAIACEPRNESWFGDEADALLVQLRVARVAADPAICQAAGRPGGWRGLSYWRLHGSPAMYRSSYEDRIEAYASLLQEELERREVWCIFDNTASSAAMRDALALAEAFGQ